MARRCRGRVITYGLLSGATLRAVDVRRAWPDRHSFTAELGDESVRVETQLAGTYWVTSVLAALATGLAAGVPLSQSADAVAGVAPFHARMSPIELPDGVTFLRDDWKASAWGVPAAFEVVRAARAARKVIVLGTVSDYHGDASRLHVRLAREAGEVAPITCASSGRTGSRCCAPSATMATRPSARSAASAS